MAILSEKQLKEIAEIIEKHVGAMNYALTGKGKVEPSFLKKFGIPENAASLIKNSYVLGKILLLMSEDEANKLSYEELKERAKHISLTKVERNSLAYAEQNAAQYVTALGYKMESKVHTKILAADKQLNLVTYQQNLIKDKVKEAIINRDTRGKLASELYHSLDDWTRDWKRVAHTELWNAKLQGEVVSILQGDTIHRNTKGGDTTVFRRPAPDACRHCKRLYLEDDGVTPKTFKLSELIANGDNVGKKTAEWQPTTHTTHPNCTCPIAVLPEGFGFDTLGNLEFKGDI